MSKCIVTDGIKFLRKNKNGDYYFTRENDATKFDTFKQAQSALNTGVPKYLRKAFFVEKDGEISPEIRLEKLIEADTSDFNRWLSSIGNFKRFVNTLEAEKIDLTLKLSDIDKEICDIRHYIEFGKLNAYQGWSAYEMLKTTLVQRRKIKDVIYIISEVSGRRYGTSEEESAKIAIQNLNRRVYKPRKLDFLFEDCGKIECEVCITV